MAALREKRKAVDLSSTEKAERRKQRKLEKAARRKALKKAKAESATSGNAAAVGTAQRAK